MYRAPDLVFGQYRILISVLKTKFQFTGNIPDIALLVRGRNNK